MRGPIAEIVAVGAVAAVITVAIAAPVLRAPSERLFGMEIVGRHHDPFTAMEQFARPISVGPYSQPVSDIFGALLARVSGAVAAYNWLVLLSFPLSAAAAYLLARYLALSPTASSIAALAYAFSPFHLAHAAYHPHIAQTQWIPLYLLALWRCLDRASVSAVAMLVAASAAVTLSNFYAGFTAAVITPVAVAMYWLVMCRTGRRSLGRLGVTLGSLAVIAASGMAYVWYTAHAVVVNPVAFAFPRGDLFRYSAKWWSYLVPPVEHPLLGATASRIWNVFGIGSGLLEQQVSLGWGIVALGLIAVFGWLVYDREQPALMSVPVLLIVAATALFCSLSPERKIGTFTFVRPSAVLYNLVPMFRSYARFGVLVQLMASLLAGIGVETLRQAGTRRAQIACVALVALAAGEYAVSPAALWRDVLPTSAHRWVTRQPGRVLALDCTPLDQESSSVQWLTGYRVKLLDASMSDCGEPNLSAKLAATGYTHVLVRHTTPDGQGLAQSASGLHVVATFDDGEAFAVTAGKPAVYVEAMKQFLPREHDQEWSWRWMGTDAGWIVVNTKPRPIVATVSVELSAFDHIRRVDVGLDGHSLQTLVVEQPRHIYQIGPFTLPPGGHDLVFHPVELPTVADTVMHDGDRRRLSLAVGTWHWSVAERP